ncbi:MAG: hypothetical protein M3209_05070 [Acidobacteriota bacterium]|nr:hypothetical protein [Acidobacteriota bacterium]
MKMPRLVSLVVSFLFFNAAILAQETASPTESQTEKEKVQKELEKQVIKMLDQAVGDAGTLKLASNRAIVYALVGDLYWEFDEKRARKLFRRAANDIIVVNLESEKEKKDSEDVYAGLYDFNDIRHDVLPLIAKHDADLALELLVETRSAKVSEVLAKAADPNAKQSTVMMGVNPDQFRVRQEIALEQRFAVLAAEQNPNQAIKLIKDSLSKGISWNVLRLLYKLHRKDEKKAAGLADEVIKKIVDTDLTKKREDLNETIRLLQFITNPTIAQAKANQKRFKFSEGQARDIASKLIATFLQANDSLEITTAITRTMSDLEKLAPERMPLLKQKHAEAMKNLPPEIKRWHQRGKIWSPNSTPEEILAELPKLDDYDRATALNSLTNKIPRIEDEERAKKLIEQIPDEKTRELVSEQYQSAKISRTAKDGKLDDAKKLIGGLSKKKTQIQKLVALATEFYKKGGEKNHETAADLMKSAKNLTNPYPEDEDELNNLMEVVRGYAVVNSDEAFRLFEPIADQINDYVNATAVLSRFNKSNGAFKKGEMILQVRGYVGDNSLLFRFADQIQLLGKADLNRINLLADRFARTDARTIVKLFIAQGFLKEEKKDDSRELDEMISYY